MNIMLKKIQVVSGQRLSDLGMVVATALFKLISIRRVVRSKATLAGTTSGLIEKLIQLVMTNKVLGMKYE